MNRVRCIVVKEEKEKDRSHCRRWRLRIKDGSKVISSKRFTGTYTEAKQAAETLVKNYKPQKEVPTFAQYARRWYIRRVRGGQLSNSTLNKNSVELRKLESHFGNYTIDSLTKPIIQDTLLNIRNEGEKPLSNAYMNQLHTTLKAILESAIDDGIIDSNPMHRLKAPSKKPQSPRDAISESKARELIATLDRLPLTPFTVGVRLCLMAGMRRGEACALRWADIYDGTIHVRQNIEQATHQVKETKTSAGMRNIPCAAPLQDLLQKWKVEQAERLKSEGVTQTEETPVIATINGGYRNPANLGRMWAANRAALGLDGVTLHALRHTFLTLMAHEGATFQTLKDVAGWATAAMADTYIHGNEDANRAAVEQVWNKSSNMN